MTLQAIRVLEAAEAEAKDDPIKATAAVRLALGWLILDRVAELHQAQRFAKAMTTQGDMVGTVAGYMRQTEMYQMLEAWRREVRRRDWESEE